MRRMILLLALAACDGNDARGVWNGPELTWGPAANQLFHPPEDVGGIAGDWLTCSGDACDRVRSQGVRFTAEGGFSLLSVSRSSGQPVAYCAQPELAKYTVQGDRLFIPTGDIAESAIFFQVDGDVLTVTVVSARGREETTRHVRADPRLFTGPCEDQAPVAGSGGAPPRTTTPAEPKPDPGPGS